VARQVVANVNAFLFKQTFFLESVVFVFGLIVWAILQKTTSFIKSIALI
jgi:hypothetical protein